MEQWMRNAARGIDNLYNPPGSHLIEETVARIISAHHDAAHPQPASEPIRVLDRIEKRVSRLEQALLKQQADEYHTDEEKPAPEPFKVPVVEIRKRDDGGYNVFGNDILLASIPSCSGTANWSDLCILGVCHDIAHTCEMLRGGQDIIATIHEPDAEAWLTKLNAGPVKP